MESKIHFFLTWDEWKKEQTTRKWKVIAFIVDGFFDNVFWRLWSEIMGFFLERQGKSIETIMPEITFDFLSIGREKPEARCSAFLSFVWKLRSAAAARKAKSFQYFLPGPQRGKGTSYVVCMNVSILISQKCIFSMNEAGFSLDLLEK